MKQASCFVLGILSRPVCQHGLVCSGTNCPLFFVYSNYIRNNNYELIYSNYIPKDKLIYVAANVSALGTFFFLLQTDHMADLCYTCAIIFFPVK